jgi:hypothetical protein
LPAVLIAIMFPRPVAWVSGRNDSSRTGMSRPVRRMSATTPMTVIHGLWVVSLFGPPKCHRRPIALPSGQ